jgi:hypothetical protein
VPSIDATKSCANLFINRKMSAPCYMTVSALIDMF